jgi:hypothetical protein
MYNTLLLDLTTWDLVVDASGNIAMASPPYALAQDVATACKTYLGEVWYDSTLGVPYSYLLGSLPSIAILQNIYVAVALTVPGVVSAQCVIQKLENRSLTGQIQFVDENNQAGAVQI